MTTVSAAPAAPATQNTANVTAVQAEATEVSVSTPTEDELADLQYENTIEERMARYGY